MVLSRIVSSVGVIAAMALSVAPAAAQVPTLTAATPCTSGPGTAFGVTAYRCERCAMEIGKDRRPVSLFHAEPVILSVQPGSLLKPDDVIVSVGGRAITSRPGAELFASAPAEPTTIEVRRQGQLARVTAEATFPCEPASTPDPQVADENLLKVQKLRLALSNLALMRSKALVGRFGFALGCLPSCTRVRASNGLEYWKFDGEPRVQQLIADGIAALSGLKVGDRVLEVDGSGVLTEAGALRLWRSNDLRQMTLVVARDGSKLTIVLQRK